MKSVFTFLFLIASTANAGTIASIKSASYGLNAGGTRGALTESASKLCVGKLSCQYSVETRYVDPKYTLAKNKAKDFTLEFTCSQTPGTTQTIHIPNNALGSKVRVSCEEDADLANSGNEIENDSDLDAALKQSGYVVIKYGAPWCGPCQAYDRDAQSIANTLGKIRFYKVNTDKYNGKAENGGIPQFHLYKDGSRIQLLKGYAGKDSLIKTLGDLTK